jgi:endoglucanase
MILLSVRGKRSLGSLGLVVAAVLAATACGGGDGSSDDDDGGSSGASSGGTAGVGKGGASGSSGRGAATGGASSGNSGAGASTGGVSSAGSSATGSGATSGGGASATGGSAGTSGAAGAGGTGVSPTAPPTSPYIVVDQFGYLPDAEKIAVIRDPQTGADAGESFTPGASYALVRAATGETVVTRAPAAWNLGNEDASSGDKAWWFDFSDITEPGEYYVLDVAQAVRSYAFSIGDGVYRDVLKQALRMFFYQRAGQDKTSAHAGAGWVDGPSHVGALQDHAARLYSAKDDAATERDLWGGWYDAGDLNKYTSWTAGYVENLLRAYAESPAAFGDDNGIPESGNGVPDVLDEAKWGMDFLVRMQNDDGSLLSIVGLAAASPPSSATGQSLYGSANTTATLATASAFAYGALVFGEQGGALASYADELATRAEGAWAWAVANPAVIFRNNDAGMGSSGLGSGQQETDDDGRLQLKLGAAVQLFRLTGEATYQAFVDDNYAQSHLVAYSAFVSPWDVLVQDALLEYADAAGATPAVVTAIRGLYATGVKGGTNLAANELNVDPYLAYMKDYVWGSNSTKSNMGNLFTAAVVHRIDSTLDAFFMRAAARYVHYLHGVNPLSLVYLTNMNQHGAEQSVAEIYHSWFKDKSAAWDRVGTSTYGPPPGFLAGGPNPSYDLDGCCPSGCGSTENNALCSEPVSPPKGQPPQKSYKDFNSEWPLNSWSVTEPSDGYQVAYVRLLAKFVR